MRLHLIDGTYELYRAHFSPRPGHQSRTGQDLKATVGVVASLLSNLRRLLSVDSASWLMRSRSRPPWFARASWQSAVKSGNVNGPVPAGGAYATSPVVV